MHKGPSGPFRMDKGPEGPLRMPPARRLELPARASQADIAPVVAARSAWPPAP